MLLPKPAERPTMYFIGVTTQQSSIMKIFPLWAQVLGIEASLVGIDVPLQAPAEQYRSIVRFIKDDPLSRGALVTTHKIDILAATQDLFDSLDAHAQKFHEISAIAKANGRLTGSAKDPISARLALEHFFPIGARDVFIMGSGGSARAILSCLLDQPAEARPNRIVLTDRESTRLDELKDLFAPLDSCVELQQIQTASEHDRILHSLPSHSLIINATGMGKDRPGSPITDQAVFPEQAYVWELNYRGSLEFLHQARQQQEQRRLQIEDGWIYFIHGWTQVIAEVFGIPRIEDQIGILSEAAQSFRPSP